MGGRAVPGNREHLALKLLRPRDLGLNKQAHRRAVGDAAHGNERGSSEYRADHRVACGDGHIQISAHHCLYGNASGADVDEICF